jgi:hypothetical protein
MEAQKLADASDIEKAANKVIGVWNGDKKPHGKTDKEGVDHMKKRGIEKDRMYLEILKARDEQSDIWALYEYNGNRGFIGKIDVSPDIEVSQDKASGGKKNRSSLYEGLGKAPTDKKQS